MPSYPDFQEPVRLMSEAVGPASDEQRALAAKVGLTLTDDVPCSVAAALLEDHLAPAIRKHQPPPATDRQRAFMERLGAPQVTRPDLTISAASAWIDHHLTVRTLQHLIELKLAKDDAVIVTTVTKSFDGPRLETQEYWVVSSIAADGLLYFKGGNGKCAPAGKVRRATTADKPADYPQFRELIDDIDN